MIPFTHRNTTGQPGGSTLLDRILDDLVKVFDSIAGLVTNDALVSAHFDGTNPTKVYHGLGRAPKTWEVVDLTTGVAVFRIATGPMGPEFVILNATGLTDALIRFT